MEQNTQNQLSYKDIVIEQLAYRISDLENYARNLLEQNNQLMKEIEVLHQEKRTEITLND